MSLLKNSSDDNIALLYGTKFLTIFLYLTKLYVTCRALQYRHPSHTVQRNPPKLFSNSVTVPKNINIVFTEKKGNVF